MLPVFLFVGIVISSKLQELLLLPFLVDILNLYFVVIYNHNRLGCFQAVISLLDPAVCYVKTVKTVVLVKS